MLRQWKFQNETASNNSQSQSASIALPVKNTNEVSAQQTSALSSSLTTGNTVRPPAASTIYTIPTIAPSTVTVGHLIPPRRLGRVMSTPPSYSNKSRNTMTTSSSSGGTAASAPPPQQSHRTGGRRSSSSNISSTLQCRISPTKKANFLPHSRSFDDKQHPLPPPVSVAVTNVHPLSSSPISTSTPSSSATSTPKMNSSTTSSTTSSTASVSSDEEEHNDDSLDAVTHARTSTVDAARKRHPRRLQRSLSSDDYNNYHNDYDSNVHRKNDTQQHHHDDNVHWMNTVISTNQASSPPQEMKLTSVRKRPSPRNECDHHSNTHNEQNATTVHRSSPPSSSSIFLHQQQLQHHHQSSIMQPHTIVGTPSSIHTTSSSSSTMVTSFRNSMAQKNDRSGSFRRRKGTKNSAIKKSLLRNKSFLLLRYMYLHRYFSTKRRSVFVLYTIGILLLLLFILSFSLSFLSSHRITIANLFFKSSPGKNITPISDGNTATIRIGNMMLPKPWNVFPKHKQEVKVIGTDARSNDSSNDNPTREQQIHDPSPRRGTSSSNYNDNNKNTNTVIHTLRGRYKKHNLITKQTSSSDKNQQKKPYKWFGFSHLLLPPKNKQQREQVDNSSNANVTIDGTNTKLRGGKLDSIVKSPIVVDGKVYNFQQYTKFAPQCEATSSDNAISVNDIDFTIATQLSYNRLWMMEYHCVRWTQAMSLAIYIGNNQSATITSESIRQEMIQMGCSEQQDVTVQVLSGYSDEEYPVNVLRNMALSKVRTTHVVYVDVDFWVSTDLYDILNQHREALLSNSKLALVVPAFQLSRQCKEWRDCREMNIPKMPHVKDELVDLMMKHQANAFDPSNRGGHGSTRYKDWLLQSEDELVPIDCVKSNRYEPYLVFRLCNELPPFQESFTGYGKNKMTWMMQVRRTGYQLMQLGGAFAVHYPHLDSTARMHWNGGADGSQLPKPHDTKVDLSKFKRGQVDETFVAFRHWLATSIPDNSVMPMCDDAQDDDQRLWIAPDKVIKVK